MDRRIDIPWIGGSNTMCRDDGVQNTMTEIWPSGQNIIWYIDPRVDFSGVQNTI
jgi:hypothetical protein